MNNSNTTIDWHKVRNDFPVLKRQFDSQNLVYFDSTATTQKPIQVIDALDQFYRHDYSSVNRGVYRLSESTTQACSSSRKKIASFLNANSENEIIFTRGTTESINLVALSWGPKFVKEGDEILISALEHHANIVPWQILCERTGASLKAIPCDDRGVLDLEKAEALITERTKLVAVTHVSNALGTINPIEKIVAMAKKVGATTLIDGAQSSAHEIIDLQKIDCDFFAFSGHKVYGPTGIGVLYGKSKILEQMPPVFGGGEMIQEVTLEQTTYAAPPARFEGGTPHIAGIIGLGAAIDYVQNLGLTNIAQHEEQIRIHAEKRLVEEVAGLHIIGTAPKKGPIISFTLNSAHPHDAAMILDEEGIAVRAGHHCAQPVMDRFSIPATLRASFGLYNLEEEVERLIQALRRVNKIFG